MEGLRGMTSLLDLPAARDCTHPVVDGEDDGGVDHAAQLHQDKDPADEGDPDPGGEAAAAGLHWAAHLGLGNTHYRKYSARQTRKKCYNSVLTAHCVLYKC